MGAGLSCSRPLQKQGGVQKKKLKDQELKHLQGLHASQDRGEAAVRKSGKRGVRRHTKMQRVYRSSFTICTASKLTDLSHTEVRTDRSQQHKRQMSLGEQHEAY